VLATSCLFCCEYGNVVLILNHEELSPWRLSVAPMMLVRDIAYVYGNIGGFRAAIGVIQTHGADMNNIEFRARVLATIGALDRAVERGAPLLEALRAKAASAFWASLFSPARRRA